MGYGRRRGRGARGEPRRGGLSGPRQVLVATFTQTMVPLRASTRRRDRPATLLSWLQCHEDITSTENAC